MIRVTVMYPNTEGAHFDMDYYVNKHMPMVADRCAGAMKGATIDAGLGGMAPGEPAAYVAMVHMTFDSLDSFQTSFGPHLPEILADVPNYTDLAPQVQISEVKE